MVDNILKTKILEKYKSIIHFCLVNNISATTIAPYCRNELSVNSMSLKTLASVCNGLDCSPSDIGYTKEFWYVLCSDGKLRVLNKML